MTDAKAPEFDRHMLEALVCPVTHGTLSYDAARQELVSKTAGLAFPIRAGEVVDMARLGLKSARATPLSTGAALERVGLADRAQAPFATLSGGQRQKVFVARALATGAPILLLDEPTAHLDPGSVESLYDLLAALGRERTIIIATHDVGMISKRVRSVACLNRTLHFHESGELTDELLSRVYGPGHRPILHDARVLQAHEHKHA